MTLDELRAALDGIGIRPEPGELAELHEAWVRMEGGNLAVLRRAEPDGR